MDFNTIKTVRLERSRGGPLLWLTALLASLVFSGCGAEQVVGPEPKPLDPEPQCIALEGVYNTVEWRGHTYTSFQLYVGVDPNEMIGRNAIPSVLAPFSAGFTVKNGTISWTYVNAGSLTNVWLFNEVALSLECDALVGRNTAGAPLVRFIP